jgi:hypothetical protein
MILSYNSFIKWKIEKKIFKSEDYKLNNRIAEKISKKNLKIIVKRYTHITPENIYFFLKINRIIWNSFEGIGIDLGGGCGSCVECYSKKKKSKKNLLRRNSKKYCHEVSTHCKEKNFKN